MSSSSPLRDITAKLKDGQSVRTVHLASVDGMRASILTYGARILDLLLPDSRSVLLSYDTFDQILADDAYINVAIGRVTNRIKQGAITAYEDIDKLAALESNDGENHIHGGVCGFDKKVFEVEELHETYVVLKTVSENGDQGYPSKVLVRVRYELPGDGKLSCSFTTENIGPHPTITNMTLHPYFDLTCTNGRTRDSAQTYTCHMPAAQSYLKLDSGNVPTGELGSLDEPDGHRHDFRQPRTLGSAGGDDFGYDNFYIMQCDGANEGNGETLQMRLSAPNGLALLVSSNQAGLQMYTANGMDGEGEMGFEKFGSVAIEPSGYVDAANNSHFPSVRLAVGETKRQAMTFQLICG